MYEITKQSTKEPKLYTVEVFLLTHGSRKFTKKKRSSISRQIQIRGDQTLQQLHEAIFDAYDRYDEHLYEFHFGQQMHDGPKYGLREGGQFSGDDDSGDAGQTTIDSLKLRVGRAFGYWFDFGDDWMHQINVVAIDPNAPEGKYPVLISSVGASPPQYPDDEESDDE